MLAIALLSHGVTVTANAQMEFSLDEAEGEESLIDSLAKEEPDTAEEERGPVEKEAAEEIYAIQQIYALRLKRFELAPTVAFNVNDPYLSHRGLGVSFNYWWTNVLALGANLVWYDFSFLAGAESRLVEDVQRSARLGVPFNEWQMNLNVNFTYVPFYGKFQAFNKYIFQWDSYIVGGVGFARTKPVPVFDPALREFNWGMRASFNVGLGVRVFVTRYLAILAEFRDYMFLERFESSRPADRGSPDPADWLEGGATFVNNATIQVGITLFFPFKFEYRLPK